MSSSTLLQNLLSSLLESPALVELGSKAGQKAISIIKEYFTLTGNEISKAYQDSYGYSVAAISVGLATPDQKLAFVQKFRHAKVTREFSDTIEINYLQPFAKQRGFESDTLPSLRKQFIGELKKVVKYKDQLFHVNKITEEDLTALISYQDSPAITDLLLEQMQGIVPVDETLLAFLRSDELLGKAMRFFFHDIVRKDDRVCKTQAALQQEGLCIEVRILQTAIKTAEDNLKQAIIEKSSHLAEIAQQFSAWRDLSNYKVEQVLDGLWQIHEKLEDVHDDVKETKGLVETILLKLQDHMERQDLSSQVKPCDEFTRHNTASLELIKEAVAIMKALPTQHPEYSHLSNMVGSALSSTGDILQAERLFIQAIEISENETEKARAYFNLFQVQLRRGAYSEALENLQAAIAIDPQHYALHDLHKYPLKRLLGAGGMGCVFLCQNQNRLIPGEHVVVKCFWETLKGSIDEVFKEPISMHKIAGDYVPKPLEYGYADVFKRERAYFITEYIEGAIDGEAWIEKYGKMDLETGLQIGLQIAKGLQLSHEKGVYHLDLKPANVLLKKTETGFAVKIIDFGLSQVAPSLQTEAGVGQSRSGLTLFGQAVFGTLDYAPPEQQGFGKPSAKSDVSFFQWKKSAPFSRKGFAKCTQVA
jgi:tetratricopeptide (TPR) repeat protein